jgi:hypothetical protein
VTDVAAATKFSLEVVVELVVSKKGKNEDQQYLCRALPCV